MQKYSSYYIKTISINNYKGFENVSFDCTKSDGKINQWTLLLGENNSGKTRILKTIAEFIREKNNNTIVWDGDGDFKPLVFGYGVTRYPGPNSGIKGENGGDFATLLSSEARLLDLESMILQTSLGAKNGDEKAQKIFALFKSVICNNDLFPEISDFKIESDFTPGSLVSNRVLYLTKDGWTQYSDLGFGYQSMLSWVVDLCFRMIRYYNDSENPLWESAVVLIDEIDLHLHPRWQRTIVPLLSKTFPNIQFIATTHSPFVIQSMKNVNLYLLKREDDKIVISRDDNEKNDYRGWSVEDILRDIMLLNENINSDEYNRLYKAFVSALEDNDYSKSKTAYDSLNVLLPSYSKIKNIIDIQFSQILPND